MRNCYGKDPISGSLSSFGEIIDSATKSGMRDGSCRGVGRLVGHEPPGGVWRGRKVVGGENMHRGKDVERSRKEGGGKREWRILGMR